MKDSTPLSALIVDDEPPARQRLQKLLSPYVRDGRIRIVGEAGDGIEALDILESEERVDILFLDIQMPELSGFDLLDRLAASRRPTVIFTTAYNSYALQAFEANAIDYLLKPISKERLAESIQRARRLVHGTGDRELNDERLGKLLEYIDAQLPQDEDPGAPKDHVRQLSVPYRDRILLVPVDQIITAEIEDGITRVFALEKDDVSAVPRLRRHVVNYTLDQLESMLPSDRFMRVHRSAIVHLDEIKELIPWFSGRYKLLLTGEHEVIASRERSKQLKETLMI